jgi:S1-C subfamily serine protease
VNLFDLIAIVVIGLGVVFGWRSGLVIQVMALLGFVAGIALVIFLAPHVAGLLADKDPWLRTILAIGLTATIVLLAQGIGGAVGGSIARRLRPSILGGVDQGLGAAFGLARGLFVVWLIGGLVGVLPVPSLGAEARQSLVLRALDSRLPSPVVIAAELGRLIQAAGLPDILIGAPPPIDAPADGPTAEQAEEMVAGARDSTVRVEAIACGRFVTGTGFAVTDEHFVTNAHVVAGGEQLSISFDGALERYPASVVDFDPDLDVALLHVPGTDVEPLTLADALPARGDAVVALGFSGGGRQRTIPGVMSRALSALGRDIYGESVVPREIIEMRLDVSPGDSGGPVLMASGEVGGVTFSEARNNPEIGYALSPVAVANSMSDSLRSTQPVPNGRCATE